MATVSHHRVVVHVARFGFVILTAAVVKVIAPYRSMAPIKLSVSESFVLISESKTPHFHETPRSSFFPIRTRLH